MLLLVCALQVHPLCKHIQGSHMRVQRLCLASSGSLQIAWQQTDSKACRRPSVLTTGSSQHRRDRIPQCCSRLSLRCFMFLAGMPAWVTLGCICHQHLGNRVLLSTDPIPKRCIYALSCCYSS